MSTLSGSRTIWVVGAGAIGSVIAARLRSDPPCRLIDTWPEHIAAIRAGGLTVDYESGETVHARLPAYHIGELAHIDEKPDIVLLAVKSTATVATLRQLLPHLTETTMVVSLQNGINEQTIAELIGAERTVGAVVLCGGELVEPGRARGYGKSGIVIGALDGAATSRLAALGQALQASVPVELTDDIWGRLWAKLVINAQINPIAALTGLRTDEVAAAPLARRTGVLLAHEAVKVALRSDIFLDSAVLDADPETYLRPLDDDILSDLERRYVDRWSSVSVKPSMLQDVEKGRPIEIDALNGHVVAAAHRAGVPAPINEAIVRLIKAAEGAANDGLVSTQKGRI